jgi:hypothetical protein
MASRITYHASVSFEYDLAPVQTYRGPIVAANASLAARRAVEAARKSFPKSSPRSIVVVLEIGERVTVPGRKLDAAEVEGVAI